MMSCASGRMQTCQDAILEYLNEMIEMVSNETPEGVAGNHIFVREGFVGEVQLKCLRLFREINSSKKRS